MKTFPIPMKAHNGYDTKAASDDTQHIHEWPPSLTVQSQAEDADINVIMQRFGITGKMPENVRIPQYGDYSNITDYRSALDAVRNAQEAFMEIPANIRAKFDNDPQKYLDFVDNPANIQESIQLGLRKQPPPQTFHVEPQSGAGNGPQPGNQTVGNTTNTTTQIPTGNPGATSSSAGPGNQTGR